MKSRDTGPDTAQRQPAAVPSERKPLRATHGAGAPRHSAFQASIDQSPRMLAQRRALQAVFGSAFKRQDDSLKDEALLQGRVESAPVQRMGESPLSSGPSAAPPDAAGERVNETGMPNQLRAGVEALSGLDMSDVRVHRNSDKPVQLNALAFAQGNDIHLGPGQEQHLPHEAWHVVQQRQGRVKTTVRMVGPEQAASAPVQRIISVTGFKAATPKSLRHGRGPNIQALDVALGTYIGARTAVNAQALSAACTNYLLNPHQPARTAAATSLRREAHAENRLLTLIGDGNVHLVDGLIAQAGAVQGAVFNSLAQLAAQVGVVSAHSLPALIQLVTPAGMAALALSTVIPRIGAANAHVLLQLIPIANGVAGLPALEQLIHASGAAHVPLLAPMIPLIGGHAQIPTLRAMLFAQGVGADAALDLARVASSNAVVFARLCGELPFFQRQHAAAGGVAALGAAAAQIAYNAAKLAAPMAELNTLHAQATVAYNAALPFALPGHPGGIAQGLLNNMNARLGAVNADILAIGAGAVITPAHRTHATQLKAIAHTVDGLLTPLLAPAVLPPAFAAVANVPTPFDAAGAAPNITTISFDHFLTRHTAHYFDFGDIKADNTQWPVAWGGGAAANVDASLAAVLTALHGAHDWLMPGVAKPGQAVAGGTAQIAGLVDAGVAGNLRVGQFFPEAGATFFDHNAATMRAIDQLV